MGSHVLTDNTKVGGLYYLDLIQNLANKDLSVLDKENFIIFPEQLSESEDLDKENYIFKSRNGEISTCNIVGVISDNKDEVRINSRFSKKGEDDYFLRYMIQKVLNYNVTQSKISSSKKLSYYDLFIFLFPYYLNQAIAKGVYKEYVYKEYNDSNIKGPIDFTRQIKNNLPFLGKIAYSTREFSYDNNVTELVRHTIEKIQIEFPSLLVKDIETKENIRLIKEITSSYKRLDRERIVQKSILNPVKSGYFEEYALLQRLCIRILNEDKTAFEDEESKVHGVIIDVSWLWEEYIWKATGWKHYGRRANLNTLRLFSNLGSESQQHRYPDFEFGGMPIDTKYKKNIEKRNDYNQLTTYIHIMNASKGGFLQPTQSLENKGYSFLGELVGGGNLFTYKFYTPQEYISYEDFVEQMQQSEEELKKFNF